MSGTDGLNLDAVFELLSESRRRYVLYYFLENEHANIEGLSLRVAAWERDTTVESVGESDRRAVAASLIHNHLPRLDEHGIVEYDQRNGDVVATEAFDRVRPTVERASDHDDAVEVSAESIESFLYSKPLSES